MFKFNNNSNKPNSQIAFPRTNNSSNVSHNILKAKSSLKKHAYTLLHSEKIIKANWLYTRTASKDTLIALDNVWKLSNRIVNGTCVESDDLATLCEHIKSLKTLDNYFYAHYRKYKQAFDGFTSGYQEIKRLEAARWKNDINPFATIKEEEKEYKYIEMQRFDG